MKEKKSNTENLKRLIERMKEATFKKNKIDFEIHLKKNIDKILNGGLSSEDINYKDKLLYITNNEYMNRFYNNSECKIRLKNYIDFYLKLNSYYQINYEIYSQRRIMYKNLKRKFKLTHRKSEQKKDNSKKTKRKNMLKKLIDSSIYLDQVKSFGSINENQNQIHNSENFDFNFPRYNKSGDFHDIYNPSFSSQNSFLSQNQQEIKNAEDCDFFFFNEQENSESSIESIITKMSKLDNIEESRINRNSFERSKIDLGDIFPELNEVLFLQDKVQKKDTIISKVKESTGFENHTNKFDKRNKVKNSIKNRSIEKNTLESKFSTDNKIKEKVEKTESVGMGVKISKKKLKKNKRTLINKKSKEKDHSEKIKIKNNLFPKIILQDNNSKLSNKSNYLSIKSKNSLKNTIKAKLKKNDYDYLTDSKSLQKEHDLNLKNRLLKNKINVDIKKISFSELSRNLSIKKLNDSESKKFLNSKAEDFSSHKNSIKSVSKRDLLIKKHIDNKKRLSEKSKLSNNRSRSLKKEYDEYDYYKNDKPKIKKNKSSERKISNKDGIEVKQRISLQNLKGKEKDILKLISKKAKIFS
jgi:hypothetical protein